MKLEDVKKLMEKNFSKEEISVLETKAEILSKKDIYTEEEAEEVIQICFPLLVGFHSETLLLQKTLENDILELFEDNVRFFDVIDFAEQVVSLYGYYLSLQKDILLVSKVNISLQKDVSLVPKVNISQLSQNSNIRCKRCEMEAVGAIITEDSIQFLCIDCLKDVMDWAFLVEKVNERKN